MRMRWPLVGSIHICCGSSPPGAPLKPVNVLPPSAEGYRPRLPIRNRRCRLVFTATATEGRPVGGGSPPPVISRLGRPLPGDLKSFVWGGPAPPAPAPPPPPPPAAAGTRAGPV